MNLAKIEELKNRLNTLRPLNETELRRLRDEFITENTYDSNAIEGSALTLRETALILQEGVTIAEKPIKDHLDAIGHKDAFDYILSLTDTSAALSERVIKDIHSLVLMNDPPNRGVYRKVPVIIIGASHTPPQPYLIQVQMETLISDYGIMKLDRHIIRAVAEFHLRFESIHPFIDGNGRTGRLILNFELIKAGLLPINIKFTDRRKYFDCFENYNNSKQADKLIDLIAGYESEELQRYIGILEGRERQNG